MHVRDIRATAPGVNAVAVQAGGFMGRRKLLTVVVVVAVLLFGPLVTTGVEVFALNLVGLGVGALLLRRFLVRRFHSR